MMPSEQPAGAEMLCHAVCLMYRCAKSLKDGTVFVINKADSLQHEQYALEVFGIEFILLTLQAVSLVYDKSCVILKELGHRSAVGQR